MKTYKTLYKRTSKGAVQEWTIKTTKDSYITAEGIKGGKITQSAPHVCVGKNPGKANETTPKEQAEKEADAKYAHKLAHGYSESVDSIDDTGYKEPMLAKQFADYEWDIEWPAQVDAKLNGVRLNARVTGVKSRKNKPFNTIPHIEKALAPIFKKYPDLFIDGELFNASLKNHLNRLIELASVAYKPKDVTPELLAESEQIVQFHVYDGYGFKGITQETPFVERRAALKELLKDVKYVHVLDYVVCNSTKEVYYLLAKAKKRNDEGVIVRHGGCPYEHKRSKYLLKAKNFVEEEFEILDLEPGVGNWAGCCKRVVLKLPKPIVGRDGKEQQTFNSNIEGGMEYLKKMLENKKEAIGKRATVRFTEYSEFGVPLTPYVIDIRNYE